MGMATIMGANMATTAALVQHSRIVSFELASSSASIISPWQSISLRFGNRGCKKNTALVRRKVAESSPARAAVKSTFTAYRDLDSEVSEKKEEETSTSDLLCCPICFNTLNRNGPTGLNQNSIRRSGFSCNRCKRSFSNKDAYLDLTILEGTRVYDENRTPGTDFFRNPLISYVYERGYRQNFTRNGFPGADEEFKLAQDYFKPVLGGVLLDVSCGSGLFTRRFARSGDYKAVIALDFSETMLRQTNEFIKEDASLASSNIALVRADVARLPFATGSIDAVHAGAAIHCWPSPAAGMAEISRILKPGGVFVGSTFLTPVPIIDFGVKEVRKAIKSAISSSTLRYWDEAELEEICGTCGLIDYSQIRRRIFIMFSARKAEEGQL